MIESQCTMYKPSHTLQELLRLTNGSTQTMIKMVRGKQNGFLRNTRVARCWRLTQNMGRTDVRKDRWKEIQSLTVGLLVNVSETTAVTPWVAGCDHRLAGRDFANGGNSTVHVPNSKKKK